MIAKAQPATILVLSTVLGLPLAAGAVGHWPSKPIITESVTMAVSAGSFNYRLSGEFRSDGVIVDAPLLEVTFKQPLVTMK